MSHFLIEMLKRFFLILSRAGTYKCGWEEASVADEIQSNIAGLDQLLTKDEVARHTKAKLNTVEAWLSSGKLTRTKIGGLTRIKLSDLLAFEERSTAAAVDHPLARKARAERKKRRESGRPGR
jgi:excisionase family DNA binding protein